MTTICFIENRGKTAQWEKVAAELHDSGHQICWIVQNHAFLPRSRSQVGDSIAVIPYPTAQDLKPPCPDLRAALEADRGRRFFGSGSNHYTHYSDQITSALLRFKPDVVIGESTLFHEQLAIRICKTLDIPYLHPSMNRYPADRFVVYRADTQIVLVGSGEKWAKDKVSRLVTSIATGTTVPTYMRKIGKLDHIQKIGSSARVWLGRLTGEKFNTPSLIRKRTLGRDLKVRLEAWNNTARCVPEGRQAILYPLQMQPEANLDIWGSSWSDQVETVESILNTAPEDVMVAIKANPKAKYEVSDRLLALAKTEARIILLPIGMTMDVAQASTLGTLTITGTVGFEAVFGKGRCISLGHPIIETYFPMFHAKSIQEAVSRILDEPDAGLGNDVTGRRLLEHLLATSFPGIINEPLLDRRSVTLENVRLVSDAINYTISAHLEHDCA